MDRLCITGGRGFLDQNRISKDFKVLRPSEIAQGFARGADRAARQAALDLGIKNTDFQVDESLDGPWPSAGNYRNERMLQTYDPTALLAYPDPKSHGTWDCISRAMRKGIYTAVWLFWANIRDGKHTYSIVAQNLLPYGIKNPLVVDRGGYRVVVAPEGVDSREAAENGLPWIHLLVAAGDDP